jgi:hypothetical protein
MAVAIASKDRIEACCYRNILHHLERYKAASDLEQALPSMNPQLYAQCAGQACIDLAELIVNTKGGNRDAFRDYFFGFLGGLSQAMDSYEADFDHFLRLMKEPPCGAAGLYFGNLAENIGKNLFGRVGGLLGGIGFMAGLAGGFLGGASVGQLLEAEGLRLQQSFRQMLIAYDQAMDAVREEVLRYL